jgi:hypothetical protein
MSLDSEPLKSTKRPKRDRCSPEVSAIEIEKKKKREALNEFLKEDKQFLSMMVDFMGWPKETTKRIGHRVASSRWATETPRVKDLYTKLL